MIPPNPTFVYKILSDSAPPQEPLPEVLDLSKLDRKHGFIHLSTSEQVPRTLQLVFNDSSTVYLLKIEYAKIVKDVRWEEGSCVPGAAEATGRDLFPHLFSNRLGRNEIDSVARWEKNEKFGWEENAKNSMDDGWLIF